MDLLEAVKAGAGGRSDWRRVGEVGSWRASPVGRRGDRGTSFLLIVAALPTLLRIRAAILLLALAASCASRSAGPSAGEDLRELARFLDAAHPRPYAFTDERTFEGLVEREAGRLDALVVAAAPPSAVELELQVALAFHRVLAAIGDGHLAVALPIFQDGAPPLPLLPVIPKRIGGAVYVDAATEAFPRGTELLAIDGVLLEEIYGVLEPLTLVDANAPTARRAALERSFARHYHLAFGVRPSYELRLRLPDGAVVDRSVPGIDRAGASALAARRISAPLGGPAPAEAQPWPFLQRIDSSLDAKTQLLRLPSFGLADQREYARRVDEIFAQLAPTATAADTLILDVRGNEGGLRTHGIAVLNHILGAPYAQWAEMAARVLRIPEAFRDRTAFPYVPEAVLAERFARAPTVDGRRVFSGDPLASMMQPRGAGYPGRVVAFVDGTTASAAAELLAALRAARPESVFIGTETGSECGGHVGELPALYTAEKTALVVLVSLIELRHVATRGCQPGHGFAPDVAISYDVADFVAGRDPYLTALAALGD